MKHVFKKNKKCLICGGTITKYLDLGNQSFANSYIKKNKLNSKELRAPLQVFFCQKCNLAQLGHIVSRDILFRDYAYFSSTSPQLESYFKSYADEVSSRFPIESKKLVIEVGSNDGILLKYFKKNGAQVLGIDPARNVAKIANKKNIPTIPKFFDEKTAISIQKKFGKAGIITANNVLAHTDNPHNILKGIRNLLSPDGVCVLEVQYLYDLIKKNEFDNTYHEHVCYFSLHPLIKLFELHDLEIFDLIRTNAQGGSIRIFAGFKNKHKVKNILRKIILLEKKSVLTQLDTFKKFSKNPTLIKKKLVTLIKNLSLKNKKIVVYGASAKGNTLLQYSGINKNYIRYIVDNAPSKQSKYTPGTHIPIHPISKLKKDIPDYVLILAWNYADSIMEKEAWLRKKGVKFIVPIPKVKVI